MKGRFHVMSWIFRRYALFSSCEEKANVLYFSLIFIFWPVKKTWKHQAQTERVKQQQAIDRTYGKITATLKKKRRQKEQIDRKMNRWLVWLAFLLLSANRGREELLQDRWVGHLSTSIRWSRRGGWMQQKSICGKWSKILDLPPIWASGRLGWWRNSYNRLRGSGNNSRMDR